jgi:hypothetical protein
VKIISNHQLNTSGIYKYIRHPSYTGLLLYYLGLALVIQNWMSLALLIFAPLVCGFVSDSAGRNGFNWAFWGGIFGVSKTKLAVVSFYFLIFFWTLIFTDFTNWIRVIRVNSCLHNFVQSLKNLI